jgi:aryl-alcohol dehydrogenase-like predicted oxidoreductase
VRQLTDALQTGATIAVNQVNYSIITRAIEFEVLPFCKSHGIGVVCYMTLLQGILTGKYESIDAIPENRLHFILIKFYYFFFLFFTYIYSRYIFLSFVLFASSYY